MRKPEDDPLWNWCEGLAMSLHNDPCECPAPEVRGVSYLGPPDKANCRRCLTIEILHAVRLEPEEK